MSSYESICGCLWSGYEPDSAESPEWETRDEFDARREAWHASWEQEVEAHGAYECQRRKEDGVT